MTLPKTFLIGNIPYEVQGRDGYIEEDGTLLWGRIKYDKQLIEVSNELKKDLKSKVLLHELVHGILENYGMAKHNKEDFVDRLSTALFDFITHNDLSFIKKNGLNITATQPLETLQKSTKVLTNEQTKRMLEPANKQTKEALEPLTSRPRQLPIINPVNSSFPLGDLAKIKEDLPKDDPRITGIKIKNDVECFKTRYKCPDCGHVGTHYAPKERSTVSCHECKQDIQKIPATSKGFPDQDDWGNYFITEGVYTGEKA